MKGVCVIIIMLIVMIATMKLKEVIGLVVSVTQQPQHLVIIIASSLVVQRQDKDTLNCLAQLMINVMITELEELMGNAVQDTLYHMTPLTVSV